MPGLRRAGGVVAAIAMLAAGSQGCEQILGLDKFREAEPTACTAGATRSCYRGADGTEGVGICRAGTQSCKDDGSGWGECVGDVLPAAVEDCGNNVDDDCNGKVNDTCACAEGSTMACYSGDPQTLGKGICQGGTATCNDDGTGYGPCVGEVTPKAEDCGTKVDDNCDGQVNEASAGCTCVPGETKPCYSGMMGTEGVGLCEGGVQACNSDGLGYGACMGEVVPAVEDCSNATDEDCDGFACSQTIWAKDLGVATYGYSVSRLVIEKATGAIYVAGGFYGSIKLGSTTLIDMGGGDVFVAKFDAMGNPVWAKSFGTSNAVSSEYPVALGVDSTGGVLIASEGNLGDGTNVMKLDASGTPVWSKACGAGSNHLGRVINSLTVDPQDNVILAGDFQGSLSASTSLDCAGAVMNTTSPSDKDIMLVKLSGTDGTPVWSKKFGSTGTEQAFGVTTDANGSIYASGITYETFSFGSSGSFVLHPGGNNPIAFIVKLNPAGTAVFTRQFGDTGGARAGQISVDSMARIMVLGTYQGTLSLSSSLSITNPSSTTPNVYVAKLDASGNGLWLKDTASLPVYITSDSKGDALIGGKLVGTATLGGPALNSAGGGADVVVAKLNGSSGALIWQRQFGDTSSQSITGLGIGKDDAIIIAGNFLGTVAFDGTTLVASAMGNDTNTFLTAIAP